MLLCLLFLFALTSLNASRLLWKWEESDDGIKYYRYQLGGEDENGWTVVDSAVKSVTLESDITTLYLQASYDGINWSSSSMGSYTPFEERKEDPATCDIGYVNLTWKNDSAYNYFRYRRDTDNENEWTETRGETTSVLLPYHNGLNTYYIQSSWDGVIWSESGVETYVGKEEDEEDKGAETENKLSLRLNAAPYSSAVYYFYEGHYIDKARTLMGTIYGASTGLELDYEILPYLRLYLDAGYAYEMKIQTVIPKQQDMHYIKGGLGFDGLISVSDKSGLYIGALGGIMAHINNNKYNIAPYFGGRLGFETEITEHFTLGAFMRVTASFLKVEDDSLYSSMTLLVDPMSLALSWSF